MYMKYFFALMLTSLCICVGCFYAPFEPGCTVLALATDQDNDILISGDTAGYVTLWDVREYCNSTLEASVTKVDSEYVMKFLNQKKN